MKRDRLHIWPTTQALFSRSRLFPVGIILLLVTALSSLLLVAQALRPHISIEAETGAISGSVTKFDDKEASGAGYVGFSAVTNPPLPGAGFLETFTGDTGLDRFKKDVFHRNVDVHQFTGFSGGSWSADHGTAHDGALTCGDPDTTSRQFSFNVNDNQTTRIANAMFTCRDHMMTSMGDVDGYSIVSFSPDANKDGQADVYSGLTSVSWDVTLTDLGGRKWWEVSVVPEGKPYLATIEWMAHTANIDTYDVGSTIVGKGPFGNDLNIYSGGQSRSTWQHVCGTWGLDPEGCASKKLRRPFKMTDNKNGTITINFAGLHTQTIPGSFPSRFQVFFKDHNYTPTKDGMPIGFTWHWDNIAVN